MNKGLDRGMDKGLDKSSFVTGIVQRFRKACQESDRDVQYPTWLVEAARKQGVVIREKKNGNIETHARSIGARDSDPA